MRSMTESWSGDVMAATMRILFPQEAQISGSVRHTLAMSRAQLRLRVRVNSLSCSVLAGRATEPLVARGMGEGGGRDFLSTGWISWNSIDYWKAEGDPLAMRLEPENSRRMVRVVRSEADVEGAPWRMAIEPDRSVLEDHSGRPIAELRRLGDGSLVLTDLNSGAERRITPEEIASRRR